MITVVLSAVALTFILNPAVKALEKRGIKRWLGILIVYVFLLLILVSLIYLAVPPLAKGITAFAEGLPRYYEQLVQNFTTNNGILQKLPVNFQEIINKRADELLGMLPKLGTFLINKLAGFSAFLVDFVLGVVLSYYLLLDLKKVKGGAKEFLPAGIRRPAAETAREIYKIFFEFIRGQGILAAAVGGLSVLAFLLLKVKFAVVLGIATGILELIPYVGPLLGGGVAVFFALGDGTEKAIWVAVIFILIQQVSNGILSPKIVGERVGLHPITTILAISLGGKLFGIWGMVLAVPVFASLKAIALKIAEECTKTEIF